jgi:methyl-accepting chemotaxis protein
MLLKKAVYGIRGTIIKSMIVICIPPLTITAIILFLFINNYSNTIAETSLRKSAKYAATITELADDETQYRHIIQQMPVNGEGFFFVMDENGTYLAHPGKQGETDNLMLFAIKNNKDFFIFTSPDGSDYLVYSEYIPARKLYIGASILKKETMVLQKSFAGLLLGLIIVTQLIIFLISVFIARKIKKPLRGIIEVATVVSQGDLSRFIIQPHYVKCSEIKNCRKKDCPAFSTSNKACWGIDGTICFEGMESLDRETRIKKYCCNCDVYHKSIRSEYEELIEAVNNMIVTTQNVVTSIKKVSAELNSESDMLAVTSSRLEGEMQNQAGYIEETTSSNEELAASIDSISTAAKNQADKMTETMKAMKKLTLSSEKVSIKAADVSMKTKSAVKDANETKAVLDTTTSKINQISENSRKIVEIIRIINDISEQINLLSLNASIEAARAGEHGRGFAVVAEEISKLADATAASTKEIEKMIQQTGSDVNEGAKLVIATNNAITQMLENISITASLVEEIAESSREQNNDNRTVLGDIEKVNEMSGVIAGTTSEQQHNSNEILKALSNINESIQVITHSSADLHNSAEELKAKSMKLNDITDYFTVSRK